MMKNLIFDLENGGGVDLYMSLTYTRVNTVLKHLYSTDSSCLQGLNIK